MMRQKGFTLVEVMVVVAIIAILSMLALPSYLKYTRQTVRTQAAIYLTYLAQEAQDYLIIHRRYPNSWAAFESGFYDGEGYGDSSAYQTVSKHYQWPPTIVAQNYGHDGWEAEPRFEFTLVPTSKLMQGDGFMCVEKSGIIMRWCETVEPRPWNE
ncbi:MAG: prepilin-type N-terminal cleavage/methylation domain-containing protein [Euryarchaeota archaeon]|nr:prepilin-type N-terminal cleavage/methylation domain-containing protein [Euryarchaeota archaeon]